MKEPLELLYKLTIWDWILILGVSILGGIFIVNILPKIILWLT